MKILIVSGSPKRSNSTSLIAAQKVISILESKNIDYDYINLSEYDFGGCIDCGLCKKSLTCSQNDDFRNVLLERVSDNKIKGVLFISPVYFGGITAQLKAFLDRTLPLRRNGFVWVNVVCGAVTIGGARNGGQEFSILDIIKFAMIQGMIIVPDAPNTSHFGAAMWNNKDGEFGESQDFKQLRNLVEKVTEISTKLS